MAKAGFKIKTKATMTPYQYGIYEDLADLYQGQIGEGVASYGGDIIPGATGLHGGVYDSALASMMGGEGTSTDALGRMLSMEPAYEVDPAARERYYDEAFMAPAMQDFQQQILPAIMEQYNAQGMNRSGFAEGALATAGGNLATDLAGIRADLLYRDEEARRDAASAAYDRALPALGALAGERESLLGVADTTRGIEGEQMAEEYGKWLYEQPYNNPWLAYTEPVIGTPLIQHFTGPKEDPWYHKVGMVVGSAMGGGM